jgi:hypothetical protein
MAALQRPRTLVVRAKLVLVGDIWGARHEMFPSTLLASVQKLVAVSQVGVEFGSRTPGSLLSFPAPTATEPIEMVQVLTLPRYPFPEKLLNPLRRTHRGWGLVFLRLWHWWVRSRVPLTVVDGEQACDEYSSWREFDLDTRKPLVPDVSLGDYVEGGSELEEKMVDEILALQEEGREYVRELKRKGIYVIDSWIAAQEMLQRR